MIIKAIFVFSLCLYPGFSPAQSESITLSQAFSLAAKNNETVKIQALKTDQAKERLSQTRGALLPSLSLSGQITRQDVPDDLAVSEIQRSAKLSLEQPLFKGMREYAGLRASEADLLGAEAQLKFEQQVLLESLSKVFFDLLASRQDMIHLQTLLDLSQKRLSELQGREKIGRSRVSEVLSAQSQVATVRSQIEGAKADQIVAENEFNRVVGIGSTVIPTANVTKLPDLKPLPAYADHLKQREDLKVLEQKVAFANESIAIARGGHLPELGLTGNYYLKREGQLKDSKWDITLGANWPLYQGGIVQSKVHEALMEKNSSELQLQAAKKTGMNDVNALYARAQGIRNQLTFLKSAISTTEKSYDEHKKDYRYGLVSNLELIQSLNAAIEAKRLFDKATYQYMSYYLSLQLAAGKPASEILNENF